MDGVVSAAMALRCVAWQSGPKPFGHVRASTSPAKACDSRFSRRIDPLCASWKLSHPHRTAPTLPTSPCNARMHSDPFFAFCVGVCIAYVSNFHKTRFSTFFVVFCLPFFFFSRHADVSSGPSPSHLSVTFVLSVWLHTCLSINLLRLAVCLSVLSRPVCISASVPCLYLACLWLVYLRTPHLHQRRTNEPL